MLSCPNTQIEQSFIMNHKSGDDKEVGVAHKVKSPENQPQFSQTTIG